VAQRYCENAMLVVYPELMRQVLNNLLLNAIDAMPNGGSLRTQVASAHEWFGWKRTGLRITIADNGTGIAPEALQRVGEPFFTTKGAAGNGMGLAVVQEIISQHSGVFKIRSCVIPGRTGTVMTMFIPSCFDCG
jgi:signal transduction histidine kinase